MRPLQIMLVSLCVCCMIPIPNPTMIIGRGTILCFLLALFGRWVGTRMVVTLFLINLIVLSPLIVQSTIKINYVSKIMFEQLEGVLTWCVGDNETLKEELYYNLTQDPLFPFVQGFQGDSVIIFMFVGVWGLQTLTYFFMKRLIKRLKIYQRVGGIMPKSLSMRKPQPKKELHQELALQGTS